MVSRAGEELAADALSVTGYQSWGCNDYALEKMDPEDTGDTSTYLVLSPRDVIIVRPRDRKDHISWLVDRRRYEEALEELEHIEATEGVSGIDATDIGQRYIEHLVGQGSSSPYSGTRAYCAFKGDFFKAAQLCPKVCGQDVKRWEDWIFVFAQKQQLRVRASVLHVDIFSWHFCWTL